MSLTGSDKEHQNGDTHSFVTVIPVEYSRHRGFLQPPDQYRWEYCHNFFFTFILNFECITSLVYHVNKIICFQ